MYLLGTEYCPNARKSKIQNSGCKNCEPADVTLIGGSGPHEGNIFVGEKPVCDDEHNAESALVVCRFANIEIDLTVLYSLQLKVIPDSLTVKFTN